MNVRLIAIVIIYGLLIGPASLANQALQQTRITVNTQGRLLELDLDGKSLPQKVNGDGFKLNYKTRGKMRSVFAIGTATQGLPVSEPVKLEGNTATAVVQTADKALEITSKFTFDASNGELLIKRKFRNISNFPVTLQTIQSHIDPGLLGVRPSPFPALGPASRRRISAGLSLGAADDCSASECPIGPLCVMPPGCLKTSPRYVSAWLYPSEKGVVVLGWSKQITLKPKQNQQPGGEASIIIRVVIK